MVMNEVDLKALAGAVAGIVGQPHVLTDAPVLDNYSRDMTVEPPSLPDLVVMPQSVEEIQAIVRLAKERSVKIAIENCPMIFSYDEWPGGNNLASTPAIWRKMWEIIPENNFGLNLDPSHLVLQMIDYDRVVREFGPKIFHVHAKPFQALPVRLAIRCTSW
jgi:sugar phosphate isomerase/epimerase